MQVTTDSAIGSQPYNQVQLLALGLVWLTAAISGVVLFEPAPVDALMMGLVLILPITGLCQFTPAVSWLLLLLLTMCAGGYITAGFSDNLGVSATYNSITLYLCLSAVVVAGFVAYNPERHIRIFFSGYMVAAVVAAATGIVGYFHLVPSLGDLFTHFGRASGTFKDANVFGPFLVPVILYAFHRWMSHGLTRGLIYAALMCFLSFALLLSFSRGAWMHLVVSLAAFAYLTFVTARTNRTRVQLLTLLVMSVIAGTIVLVVALQSKHVRELFEHRAALTQSYDVGPNGRFGGQQKAAQIILEHPLGIGAGIFGRRYHHEQPHNVYLTIFLRAGWIGGLAYLVLILTTLGLGFRHALKDLPTRHLFLVLYSTFVGLSLENLLVDTDHWRHFYVLLGMIWGVMSMQEARVHSGPPFREPVHSSQGPMRARGSRRAPGLAAPGFG